MEHIELYAITDERFHPGRSLVEVMEEAIHGGADLIQFRDKWSSKSELFEKAKQLRALTKKYNIPLIINDYIDLAIEIDADGVHLGQDDVPLAEARKRLGTNKIIGISTHHINEARQAEKDGADYIGAGPVFATKTKADVTAPVTLSYIREVAKVIRIPFVAIGGIKLHNADDVLAAGARCLCAVSEITGSANVRQTCEAFKMKIREAKLRGGDAQ